MSRPPVTRAPRQGLQGSGTQARIGGTGDALAQRLQQAMELHRTGKLGPAEAAYKRILAVAPDQPDALHLLGLVAYQSGRAPAALALIDKAIAVDKRPARYHNSRGVALVSLERGADAAAAFRDALARDPAHVDALVNLANLLRRQGDAAGAAELFRRAVARRADSLDALLGLGGTLCETGRVAEALPHLDKAQGLAARLRPGDPGPLTLLGNALAALRRPAAAECFERALKLKPDHLPALAGLGDWYRRGGRPERAVEYFERAAAADPADPRRQAALADALVAAGRYDEAEACLRPIAVVAPDFLPGLILLARLLRVQGRFDESLEWLERAAALAPDDAEVLTALAEHHGAAMPDDALARLRAAVAGGRGAARPAVAARFALAQALDARGEAEAAFAEFARANADWRAELAQAGRRYDPARQERDIDRLIEAFTPDAFARGAAAGLRSELPVFVVGMPRAGTTLVEQMLASHTAVHAAGELRLVADITAALPAQLGPDAPLYPECLEKLSAETLHRAAEDHVDRLQALARDAGRPAARRVVDKQPLNFLHLGLIATLWPQARIVHCRRDPRDTLLSCYTQFFDTPYAWCWDLDSLAHFHRQYERLMNHWRAVLPVPLHEVAYEAMVADPETGARRLVDFVGLDWQDACAAAHLTARPVATASVFQVRRPVYASSVGRWRRYERQLRPLLNALGKA